MLSLQRLGESTNPGKLSTLRSNVRSINNRRKDYLTVIFVSVVRWQSTSIETSWATVLIEASSRMKNDSNENRPATKFDEYLGERNHQNGDLRGMARPLRLVSTTDPELKPERFSTIQAIRKSHHGSFKSITEETRRILYIEVAQLVVDQLMDAAPAY